MLIECQWPPHFLLGFEISCPCIQQPVLECTIFGIAFDFPVKILDFGYKRELSKYLNIIILLFQLKSATSIYTCKRLLISSLETTKKNPAFVWFWCCRCKSQKRSLFQFQASIEFLKSRTSEKLKLFKLKVKFFLFNITNICVLLFINGSNKFWFRHIFPRGKIKLSTYSKIHCTLPYLNMCEMKGGWKAFLILGICRQFFPVLFVWLGRGFVFQSHSQINKKFFQKQVIASPPIIRQGRVRDAAFYNKGGNANGIEVSDDADAGVEILMPTPMMLSFLPNCHLLRKIRVNSFTY